MSNLKLKPRKCTFGQNRVRYLGHIISQDGVATDPDKTTIVETSPVPQNVSNVRSFLGITGYYRRYVNKYSQIAEPLTNLMRKNTPFVWSKDCQQSFETLKQKLVETPILAYPISLMELNSFFKQMLQ